MFRLLTYNFNFQLKFNRYSPKTFQKHTNKLAESEWKEYTIQSCESDVNAISSNVWCAFKYRATLNFSLWLFEYFIHFSWTKSTACVLRQDCQRMARVSFCLNWHLSNFFYDNFFMLSASSHSFIHDISFLMHFQLLVKHLWFFWESKIKLSTCYQTNIPFLTLLTFLFSVGCLLPKAIKKVIWYFRSKSIFSFPNALVLIFISWTNFRVKTFFYTWVFINHHHYIISPFSPGFFKGDHHDDEFLLSSNPILFFCILAYHACQLYTSHKKLYIFVLVF